MSHVCSLCDKDSSILCRCSRQRHPMLQTSFVLPQVPGMAHTPRPLSSRNSRDLLTWSRSYSLSGPGHPKGMLSREQIGVLQSRTRITSHPGPCWTHSEPGLQQGAPLLRPGQSPPCSPAMALSPTSMPFFMLYLLPGKPFSSKPHTDPLYSFIYLVS